MNLFWEYLQNEQPDQADNAEDKINERAIDLELRCDRLEKQLSSLRIFVQALIDLTWDKFDLSNEQLQARIDELKEEEKCEVAEQTASKKKPISKAFTCPNCGKPVALSSRVCFYCGKPASPPETQEEPS